MRSTSTDGRNSRSSIWTGARAGVSCSSSEDGLHPQHLDAKAASGRQKALGFGVGREFERCENHPRHRHVVVGELAEQPLKLVVIAQHRHAADGNAVVGAARRQDGAGDETMAHAAFHGAQHHLGLGAAAQHDDRGDIPLAGAAGLDIFEIAVGKPWPAQKEHLENPVEERRLFPEEEDRHHAPRHQRIVERQHGHRQHARRLEDVEQIRQRGKAPFRAIECKAPVDQACIDDEKRQHRHIGRQARLDLGQRPAQENAQRQRDQRHAQIVDDHGDALDRIGNTVGHRPSVALPRAISMARSAMRCIPLIGSRPFPPVLGDRQDGETGQTMKQGYNPVFAAQPTTIFEAMSALARETGAINLGQGFPDDPGPDDVRAKAAEALLHGYNQYPPMMGLPELRQAVADHYRRFQGLDLDPMTSVMVTSGATEALAAALMGILCDGDEVVLFQPMYDAYLPLVERAGGIARFVTLRPPHWRFTEEDLAAAITPRTKAIVFNNPLNPTGTVFAREDLELLARACVKNDVIAICDEVWEHLIFDRLAHIPLMALPGMAERTVKISSAGKIFSLTGWKVGLVMAAPDLMKVLGKAHQFLTFTTAPNLQVAVAHGLAKEAPYFDGVRAAFQRSRDRFTDGLVARGFDILPSMGTYFVCADISKLGETDVDFCQRLVRERGVAAIPVSAFYAQDKVTSAVRFCFAKKDETLDAALARLDGLFG